MKHIIKLTTGQYMEVDTYLNLKVSCAEMILLWGLGLITFASIGSRWIF